MSTINADDFKEITELRDQLSSVVSDVGQHQLQVFLLRGEILELEKHISEQSIVFSDLLKKEEELIKRLSETYGVGSINFETGEFTPEK